MSHKNQNNEIGDEMLKGMVFIKRSMAVLAFLALLAGIFIHINRKNPRASPYSDLNHGIEEHDTSQRPNDKASEWDGAWDRHLAAVDESVADQPAHPEEVVASGPVTDAGDSNPQGGLIKKVISEQWIDPVGKPGRQRVRIVESDFKYPYLRLEESVTIDPNTGVEEVSLIRASVADHLMVGLKSFEDVQATREIIKQSGYKIRTEEEDSFLLVEISDFENAGDQSRHIDFLEQFSEFINYAEPDWLVFPALMPNDPALADRISWGLHNPGGVAGTVAGADINAPEAWAVRAEAPDVVVAVTDTGIRYTHEDLAANMWTNADEDHGYDFYDLDTDPMDPDGHGTHCAGTIGAVGNNGLGTAGVAWNVQLMAVRFIGPLGGATSDAIRSINFARHNGADVINASWGGSGYSIGLDSAIRACHAAGIPFVTAAGNLNMNNDAVPYYPGSLRIPNIVTVAATDASDLLASFSNYGRFSVNVAAPGDQIWSCGIASDSDYRHLSGTSMAAPYVAGALALAKAHFPDESGQDIINRLYISIDKLGSLNGRMRTAGRLNLHRFLVNSDPVPPHNNFSTALWYRTRYWEWTGSNARMTEEEEAEDLIGGPGTRSMWFFWTAPGDGLARIKAEAELDDLILEIYQGHTLAGRKLIRNNQTERPTKTTELFFNVKKGQTYSFYMDSAHELPQDMGIQGWLYPTNDMFDHAIDLGSGSRITGNGDNTGATAELFERDMRHAGRRADRSIWWKWTPDFSGSFVLGTQRSEIDTVLAVYTGTKGNLIEVASNDDVNPQDWTSQVHLEVQSGITYHIVVDSYYSNSTGSIVLDGYRPSELFILKQPQGASAKVGAQATFRVSAAGIDLRYQWEFNGEPIPGAIRPSLTIHGVLPQDYGNYRVRISNLAAQIDSATVTLSEISTPPRVVWQSRSLNATEGDTVKLFVEVTGSDPMTYQWYQNEDPIPGANSKMLELPDVDNTHEGTYRFTATNALGNATSSAILLSVYASPWDGWQPFDPSNQAGAVFGIVYQGGQWVAGSRAYPGNRISISQNGHDWKHHLVNPAPSVTSCSGSFLVHGNGMWLFGGQGQSNFSTIGVVYKSTDLVNWQQINIGIPLYTNKVVFHDGAFFLMNGDSTSARIYRSVDGVTWQQQFRQDGIQIRVRPNMASSPHGLVISGDTASSLYFLPTSSTVWQNIDMDPTRNETCREVYWFKDRYIASASGIYESFDGVNWNGPLATGAQQYPGYPMNQSWLVEHGDQIYGTSSSLDGGQNWITNSNFYPLETQAAASNGSLVVFGTAKGAFFATANPASASYNTPMMSTIQDMKYEGGQFVIQTTTLRNGSIWPAVAVSPDSESWNIHPLLRVDASTEHFGGFNVKWINGEFWRDGRYVSFPSNTDHFFRGPVPSCSWRVDVPDLAGTHLTDYTEGHAGILAVRIPGSSTSGNLVKSTDGGATWTPVTIPGEAPTKFSKVEYLGGVYYHNSSLGTDHVSADLMNWTPLGNVNFITEHNGMYWAWESGNFRTSSDMLNWSDLTLASSRIMTKPVSFGGAMVTVFNTSNKRLQYTYDGINWVSVDVGFMPQFLVSDGNVLLVGGSGGQIVRTGSVARYAPVVSIVEPLSGSVSTEGGQLKVIVDAFNVDQVGTPTVELYANGVSLGEKSAPPYEFGLPLAGIGEHLIHVEARQGSGPVALAHRHISVAAATPANTFVGVSGTNVLPGSVQYLNGTYFSSGRFDGSHSSQSSLVMMSHDLVNWTPVSLLRMSKAVSGNNRLLTTENNGSTSGSNTHVSVTSDGVNWLKAQLPATAITPIHFSHGHFWAMATTGVMFSVDGINWSFRRFNLAPGGSTSVSSIVSVGDPNGNMIARVSNQIWRTSDGGATWFRILQDLSSSSAPVIDGDDFFIWGSIGGIKNFGTSEDGGATWSFAPYPSGYQSLSVVNRVVFAFGHFNRLMGVSQDGVNWHHFEEQWIMGEIIVGEDGYFLSRVTQPGGEGVYRSVDGIDWHVVADLPTAQVFGLVDTPDGLFATTTDGGLWHLRDDAQEWEVISEPAQDSVTFKSIAGEGERLLALGDQQIFTSGDHGRSWGTTVDPAGAKHVLAGFTELFYRDGVWLAWHKGSALLRSTDGMMFTNITTIVEAADFEVLAPGAEHWLAIKADGSVWSSLNGLSWATHAAAGSYPDPNVSMLRELDGQWFAMSVDSVNVAWPNNTRLLSSMDGQNWQVTNMPKLGTARVLARANGILMVGDGIVHRYSSNLTQWSNTSATSRLFTGSDGFYLLRNGWLERSTTGTGWVRERQVDPIYSSGQFVDGAIFLLGKDRIARISDADVIVKNVSLAAGEFAVGDTIEFSMELMNAGSSTLAAGSYPVEVSLSIDGYHGNEDDTPLGTAWVDVQEVLPGASTAVLVSAKIPNRVNPGAFRISVIFDRERAVFERSAANNFCMSEEAVVMIPAWTLQTNSNGQGEISQNSNQRWFANGSVVSLVAMAGKGAAFEGWGGDAIGAQSQISILMDGDKTVQANFTSRFSLQVYVEGMGNVTQIEGRDGQFDYAQGALAELSATAADGWVFGGWSGAASGNEPSVSIPMDESKALTATFMLPLVNWRSRHFSASELEDSSISGDDADPDGDGLTNWQEYLLGSDPRDKRSKGKMEKTIENGYLSMVYTRLSMPENGMSLRCVGSRDLRQWDAPDIEERVLSIENGIESVETRIPTHGHDRGFLRLEYSR